MWGKTWLESGRGAGWVIMMNFQGQADDFILRATREWARGGLAGFLRGADNGQETLIDNSFFNAH